MGKGESWRVSPISSRQWLNQSLLYLSSKITRMKGWGSTQKSFLPKLNADLGGEPTTNGDQDEDGEVWRTRGMSRVMKTKTWPNHDLLSKFVSVPWCSGSKSHWAAV